jgi:hypothetical protein
MPNWASIGIDITGDKDSIKQITDAIEECSANKKLLFESLVGRDFQGTDEEYENGGWYNHNLDRFSTKWDLRIDEDNDNGNSYDAGGGAIWLNLNTAWSPPTGFCELLSAKYPKVHIHMQFEEGGSDYFGQEEFEAGVMTRQEIYSYRAGAYKWEPELFWAEVESDIESMMEDADDIDTYSVEDYLEEISYDFITEDDKKTIQTYIDTQRNYIKEMGTLQERLEKHRESLKKES